jgi:hypothetical protein
MSDVLQHCNSLVEGDKAKGCWYNRKDRISGGIFSIIETVEMGKISGVNGSRQTIIAFKQRGPGHAVWADSGSQGTLTPARIARSTETLVLCHTPSCLECGGRDGIEPPTPAFSELKRYVITTT